MEFNLLAFVIALADISLIYCIYYRVLLLFSSSRTNKVIWGMVVLAVITILAQKLNFNATFWIMRQIWVAGALAIVIVFQPEIRRGLMTVGTVFTKIGGASNPLSRIRAMVSRKYTFIPQMIEAIKIASDEKIGMLIVLEQTQGLKDFINEGIILDAVVSKELLLTIFFDKTLLHDGAVLISNDRLVLAGGVLPLTEQKELSKVLGTRHRAALGMSENSDAIVIVVSEESGRVSMARNGMLQRVNIHDLEARLVDLYSNKVSEKRSVRKDIRPVIQLQKAEDTGIGKKGEYIKPTGIKDIIIDFFLNPPDLLKVNWHIKFLSFFLSMITYLYAAGGH